MAARFLSAAALTILVPLIAACDPAVSVRQRGVVPQDWDAACLEGVLNKMGRASLDSGQMRTTISVASDPQTTLTLWPLRNGGWGYEMMWGKLGNKLDPETRDRVTREFDKQLAAVEQGCGVKFYELEAQGPP